VIRRRAWRFRDGIALTGLCALAVVATWGVWRDIVQLVRTNEEQSHVLLAPVVAAWLFWVRRERARLTAPTWSLWGAPVIVAGWTLAWFGFGQGHLVFLHFGALLMVFGAALTVLGLDFVVKFAPAFGALVFLMPVPGMIRHRIALPLQEATAQVTHFIMELIGQPVTVAGNVLRINGHDVAVAEACNGMRMVSALGLVAFAFVFSTPMRNWVRLLILAISPVVALIVNVVRLGPTVLMYGYADLETAELFHDISGWAVLGLALAMLWAVLATLRWLEVPVAPFAAARSARA